MFLCISCQDHDLKKVRFTRVLDPCCQSTPAIPQNPGRYWRLFKNFHLDCWLHHATGSPRMADLRRWQQHSISNPQSVCSQPAPTPLPWKSWNSNAIPRWVCLKIWYIPNYSHLIGIMISKTIGFRGTNHFQTNPDTALNLNRQKLRNFEFQVVACRSSCTSLQVLRAQGVQGVPALGQILEPMSMAKKCQ